MNLCKNYLQDMIVAKLRTIPGVNLAEPKGAFYVLPEMSAFFGPGDLSQVNLAQLNFQEKLLRQGGGYT